MPDLPRRLLPLCMLAAALQKNPRAEYIRAHYTKFEHRVPMRDGVKLFTSVFVPNDHSRAHPSHLLLGTL